MSIIDRARHTLTPNVIYIIGGAGATFSPDGIGAIHYDTLTDALNAFGSPLPDAIVNISTADFDALRN